MLLNYTYCELTIFTANDLAVRNICVASKQASILVYNKNFSSESPATLVCHGIYPVQTRVAGLSLFYSLNIQPS